MFLAIISMGLFGCFCGGFSVYPSLLRTGAVSREAAEYPLPHHLPKYPGGVSLRFAMVHDVIHERFPRHGKRFYQERNRLARKALEQERAKRAAGEKPSAAYFGHLDDLGVGLDLLGQHEEAIALMREKLKEQEALGQTGRDLYSTYANLGTFLILWQLSLGLADDPLAKLRMTEGLEWVHRSIEVNPQSHFGREVWQAVILEFLIAAIDKPGVLLKYDMIGDRLDYDVEPLKGRAYHNYAAWSAHQAKRYLESRSPSDDDQTAEGTRKNNIAEVGAEGDWSDEVKSSHSKPVSFDEPALGIIGMWRLGGGANPHFAMALAEIMLRVGQPYIAWCGYERAAQMGQYVWPDPKIQQGFIDHCRLRQAAIEERLPADEVKQLRPRFDAELAFGRHYQEAYQAYEAERIAAGGSIDDPHFYDAFESEHRAIASPIGPADRYLVQPLGYAPKLLVAMNFLFAGLFAFLTALAFWLIRKRRSSPANAAPFSAGKNPESA